MVAECVQDEDRDSKRYLPVVGPFPTMCTHTQLFCLTCARAPAATQQEQEQAQAHEERMQQERA